ncbi:molybdenum cofactor guanylyltransferase MobA [Acidocella aminolytica]|jgi:molybdopterin-guanine dinucleotide biosynthesis protein A|uniref:Molybdenum cofactor guanylyltransferase n=1 Tax=Acidocella aminolytica 101 = DSM 11237 TaxID=1120923 RepID=A0A0D6PFH9_9PROT|nr:molybdenum cofactor guanylyltransferase MobA [Acidocella aminolytica]GAN80432.1 molybdopterin-guanine dinucleotide biosynthesis protein A [Acidocella aminolytica 101 = DSM 11237]GBQ35750.1 molybdopterin-guanine dinucleotide biosynthesis protein A [Acidocella aminolytica 101 = DSM 11237]SHE96628.1 molybdenum cofactor guanylyltransferase [Acidocella aminolytica 101 = DSM 11237]
MTIAALILAGGKATRFGGADKAFVPLHGRPLIAHVLDLLRPQVAPIAISANGDPARFIKFGLPVLPDAPDFSACGPLAGVAAGLAWAKRVNATFLLTMPVDTPFFPATLVADLSPGPSVAVYAGRQHHLVALWPVSFLPALEDFLHRDAKYKVRDALTLCLARPVHFTSSRDPFTNLNSPADLLPFG